MRALSAKAPPVTPGLEWPVYYACFACGGFTDARAEAETVNALMVDLARLDADRRAALLT